MKLFKNKLFLLGWVIVVIMSLGYWLKPFEMDWDFGILVGFGAILFSIFIELTFTNDLYPQNNIQEKKEEIINE